MISQSGIFTVMELVIIISTITSFFSHHLIERAVVANSVSVIFASLIPMTRRKVKTMNAPYFIPLSSAWMSVLHSLHQQPTMRRSECAGVVFGSPTN